MVAHTHAGQSIKEPGRQETEEETYMTLRISSTAVRRQRWGSVSGALVPRAWRKAWLSQEAETSRLDSLEPIAKIVCEARRDEAGGGRRERGAETHTMTLSDMSETAANGGPAA